MDMNEYALEVLARDRLAELRATGERANRARAGRRSRRLRVALGHVLIRLGHRLQGRRREYSLVTRDARDAMNRASERVASQPLTRAS